MKPPTRRIIDLGTILTPHIAQVRRSCGRRAGLRALAAWATGPPEVEGQGMVSGCFLDSDDFLWMTMEFEWISRVFLRRNAQNRIFSVWKMMIHHGILSAHSWDNPILVCFQSCGRNHIRWLWLMTMYIHTYIHAYIYIHAYMHYTIHAYMHTCIHAYMHTCIHAYMHTCIHAYMHTCTYMYIHVHTCTYMYITICIYIIYICMYICMYMDTCIHHTDNTNFHVCPRAENNPWIHWISVFQQIFEHWRSYNWVATLAFERVLTTSIKLGLGRTSVCCSYITRNLFITVDQRQANHPLWWS